MALPFMGNIHWTAFCIDSQLNNRHILSNNHIDFEPKSLNIQLTNDQKSLKRFVKSINDFTCKCTWTLVWKLKEFFALLILLNAKYRKVKNFSTNQESFQWTTLCLHCDGWCGEKGAKPRQNDENTNHKSQTEYQWTLAWI